MIDWFIANQINDLQKNVDIPLTIRVYTLHVIVESYHEQQWTCSINYVDKNVF